MCLFYFLRGKIELQSMLKDKEKEIEEVKIQESQLNSEINVLRNSLKTNEQQLKNFEK